MIPGDWANMCQAVWKSPLLPLHDGKEEPNATSEESFGTGARFKRDLLAYLDAYGSKKTGPLVEQLKKYDFSGIKAMLIASIPSKQKVGEIASSTRSTLWGWPALKDTLRHVPRQCDQKDSDATKKAHIVVQVHILLNPSWSNHYIDTTR
jgi:tyrosyl-DNA phosphodiesterase-1